MKLKSKILLIFFALVILQTIFAVKTNASDVQNAMWFMDDLYITQVPDGDFSHKGTQNFDVIGLNNNNIFAPFDCKVIAIYNTFDSGNTVVIESLNPVRYADQSQDYMSMAFAHDNDISDLYVGKEIMQGEVFYQTGNYGNVTGIHSHVTCIRGKYQNDMWTQNSVGNYCSPNAIYPTSALFISKGTNVVQNLGLDFKVSFELEVTAQDFSPATIKWNEVEGTSYYRIMAENSNGGRVYSYNSGSFGFYDSNNVVVDATSYEGYIMPGNYRIYIDAFDKDGQLLSTSNKVEVSVKDVNLEFADEKFKSWLISHGCDNNNDNEIQFSEMGTSMYFSDSDYQKPNFDDCTILSPEIYNKIKEVTIGNCGNINASMFKGMKKITSINELNISSTGDIDDIDLLLSYFPNVKKLTVNGRYYPGSGGSTNLLTDLDVLDKFEGLTYLNLCINPTEDDLMYIIKHKNTLKELCLSDFLGGPITKDYSLLGNLTNLENLSLSGCVGSYNLNDGIFISNLKKLKTLNLCNVTFNNEFSINNDSVKEMSISCSYFIEILKNGLFNGLTNLEELSIGGNQWYDSVSTTNINWNSLSNLKNLKNLVISYYHIDSIDFLADLTNLENIDFYMVKDAKKIPELKNLKKLKNLSMSKCDSISDITGLINLVKGENSIEKIYIDSSALNPNSKTNQPLFDLLNKKKIKYEVSGYWLKEFINEVAMGLKTIETTSLGTIGMFSVNAGVTVGELITADNFPISETYDVNVVSGGGAGKSLDEKVGSKDKVQIVNSLGEILKEYTVVVPGDVTGNGLSKIYDAFKILHDSVKDTEIDELDIQIRDYDGDGNVRPYDALQYLKQTLKN